MILTEVILQSKVTFFLLNMQDISMNFDHYFYDEQNEQIRRYY